MSEPFPAVTAVRPLIGHDDEPKTRRRRKSNNLPEDPPGDTGNVAVATSTYGDKARKARPRPASSSPSTSSSVRAHPASHHHHHPSPPAYH